MVFVSAVRIIFRLDKPIGKLEPSGEVQEVRRRFNSREELALVCSDSANADRWNFQSSLSRADGAGGEGWR